MPYGLKSNVKLFTDDTSLFSVVKNKEASASDLTNDFDTFSKWAYNCKMSFNRDPKKNPRKRYSLEKARNTSHPIIYFNSLQVQRANRQKDLGIILKLSFKCHIGKVLTTTRKNVAVIFTG